MRLWKTPMDPENRWLINFLNTYLIDPFLFIQKMYYCCIFALNFVYQEEL